MIHYKTTYLYFTNQISKRATTSKLNKGQTPILLIVPRFIKTGFKKTLIDTRKENLYVDLHINNLMFHLYINWKIYDGLSKGATDIVKYKRDRYRHSRSTRCRRGRETGQPWIKMVRRPIHCDRVTRKQKDITYYYNLYKRIWKSINL